MFLLKNLDMNFGKGAIFSIVAMVLVFLVLTILVFSIMGLSRIKFKEKNKKEVKAETVSAPAKKLTIEDITDEDMMVACLVATADYIEETKEKDARVVSVKQIG